MYSDQQLKWRPLILVGCAIALLVWSIILVLLGGANFRDLAPSLLKFGIVSTVVFLIWMLFVKKAWRWKWARCGGWLVSTPDLNGRWVGTAVSTFDGRPRPMTLEIRQTLLRIHCVGYGPENVAEGYSARILCDPEEEKFMVTYLYRSRRKASSSIPGDQHEGVKVLWLIDGPPRRLRGYYLNNRDPSPRKADLELEWESATLKETL